MWDEIKILAVCQPCHCPQMPCFLASNYKWTIAATQHSESSERVSSKSASQQGQHTSSKKLRWWSGTATQQQADEEGWRGEMRARHYSSFLATERRAGGLGIQCRHRRRQPTRRRQSHSSQEGGQACPRGGACVAAIGLIGLLYPLFNFHFLKQRGWDSSGYVNPAIADIGENCCCHPQCWNN